MANFECPLSDSEVEGGIYRNETARSFVNCVSLRTLLEPALMVIAVVMPIALQVTKWRSVNLKKGEGNKGTVVYEERPPGHVGQIGTLRWAHS